MDIALEPKTDNAFRIHAEKLETAQRRFHEIQGRLAAGMLEDEDLDKLLTEMRETLRLIAALYAEDTKKPGRWTSPLSLIAALFVR